MPPPAAWFHAVSGALQSSLLDVRILFFHHLSKKKRRKKKKKGSEVHFPNGQDGKRRNGIEALKNSDFEHPTKRTKKKRKKVRNEGETKKKEKMKEGKEEGKKEEERKE